MLITIGFTSPPSVMTCGFQMISSMGPLMDWEVMERQKWLCRGQDVTQGNVIRLIRAVYRSWDRLSSSISLFQMVVKDREGAVLDLMSWRQSYVICPYFSLSTPFLVTVSNIGQAEQYVPVNKTNPIISEPADSPVACYSLSKGNFGLNFIMALFCHLF